MDQPEGKLIFRFHIFNQLLSAKTSEQDISYNKKNKEKTYKLKTISHKIQTSKIKKRFIILT